MTPSKIIPITLATFCGFAFQFHGSNAQLIPNPKQTQLMRNPRPFRLVNT
jgi:hypothetical protein